MTKCGFCTIVTRSHLKYAVALATSLQRYHPALKLCVLLIDFAGMRCSVIKSPSMEVFQLDELQVPNVEDMRIYFDHFELSNCLKPFFISHLLSKGFEKIVYLDADILVVDSFDDLFQMLDQYAFILTPHWLRPDLVQNSTVPAKDIADLGIYNGGMWGLRCDRSAMVVLEWLMRFLPEFGFKDPQNGMFVDQKLLPLAAQLFSSQFGCMTHPGYNVAHWNLHEREVTKTCNRYFVNGQPLVFFHLSGFRVEDTETFSRYSSWTFDKLPILRDIVAEYLSYIPLEEVERIDVSYDNDDHRKLTPELRRYYFIHRTFSGFESGWKRTIRRGLRLLCRPIWPSL
jgi:hypothetical protein